MDFGEKWGGLGNLKEGGWFGVYIAGASNSDIKNGCLLACYSKIYGNFS